MIAQRVRGFYHLFVRVQLALVLAYYWLHFLVITHFYSEVPAPEPYLVYCVLILLGTLVEAFQRYEIDTSWLQKSLMHKHRIALRQTIYAVSFVIVYLVATKDLFVSRVFLFSLLPALYLVLFTTAWWLPVRLARILFRNQRIERTLVIGSGERLRSLRDWFQRKAELGFSVIGAISDEPAGTPEDIPVLGGSSDFERIAQEQRATQVLLLDSPLISFPLQEMTTICEQQGIRLLVLSDLAEKFRHPLTYMEDDGLHFFGLRREPLESPVNRAIKRTLDLVVAIPVVLFILPVASVLVWLLHRWQSPGPLFYLQDRMGLQSQPFRIVKFRTMHPNNADIARQASVNDERFFPAGRWLRKFSVDELPQFWNVLRGEMSVVGPRPHLIEHNKQFAQLMRNYYVRALVKPGISGLAQVRGFRGETKEDSKLRKRIESDIDYLEHWSFSMDVFIILRTVGQIVRPPKSAY